jgi:hypothetical protein
MRFYFKAVATLTLASLLLGFHISLVGGQVSDMYWSTPYRLSTIENVYQSGKHAATADPYGFVHTFWVERLPSTNAYIIQYARFNGEGWTSPIDIYLSNNPIDRLSTTVGWDGTLHLMWTEGGNYRLNPIHHMHAPAHEALSVRRWSKPHNTEIQAHLLHLQVDLTGSLHLVYSQFFGSNAGLYYVRSEDEGLTWSIPSRLDPDTPPNSGPDSLQFQIDEKEILHLSWFYLMADVGGDWIRYMNSLDKGESWSSPLTVDRDTDRSGRLSMAGPIMAAGGGNVHIVWAGGNLHYRNHRYSIDRGLSWSSPTRIFGNLNGQAGDSLVTDETGKVHFAGQIRYPQGIYHALWDKTQWTTPSLIYLISQTSTDIIGDRYHAHNLILTLRGGNQPVLVFYDRADDRPHVLYAMQKNLYVDTSLSIIPTPTETRPVIESSSPVDTSSIASTSIIEDGSREVGFIDVSQNESQSKVSSPGTAIWISASLATSCLMMFFMFHISRRKK